MTQLKCLYSWKLHFHHNHTVLSGITKHCVLSDCARNERVILSLLKLSIESVFKNYSCFHLATQATYCLVNLWILSGQFPLDSSSTATPLGFPVGSRLRQSALLARRCTLPGLCVQDLISTESACPCVSATHLPALHLSFLPFCKHTPLTFWKILAFTLNIDFCWLWLSVCEDCTYYWLCDPMTICTAFPPLCISVKSSNNIHLVSHNPFSLFFLSFFRFLFFFHIFCRSPLAETPFFMPPKIRVSAKLRSLMSLRLGSDTLDVHWLNAPGLNSPLSPNSKRQLCFTCCIIAYRLKFCCFCFEFTSFTDSGLLFWFAVFFFFYILLSFLVSLIARRQARLFVL